LCGLASAEEYVTDNGNCCQPATLNEINAMIVHHKESTGVETFVYTYGVSETRSLDAVEQEELEHLPGGGSANHQAIVLTYLRKENMLRVRIGTGPEPVVPSLNTALWTENDVEKVRRQGFSTKKKHVAGPQVHPTFIAREDLKNYTAPQPTPTDMTAPMSREELVARIDLGQKLTQTLAKVFDDEVRADPFHNDYVGKRNRLTGKDWLKILIYTPIILLGLFVLAYIFYKLGGPSGRGGDYSSGSSMDFSGYSGSD